MHTRSGCSCRAARTSRRTRPGWARSSAPTCNPATWCSSHVGIYIGEGRFIHAPRTGAEVRVEDMRASYWAQRYDGARRAAVLMATTTAAPPPAPTPPQPIAFVL
jgi:hypothetical protein